VDDQDKVTEIEYAKILSVAETFATSALEDIADALIGLDCSPVRPLARGGYNHAVCDALAVISSYSEKLDQAFARARAEQHRRLKAGQPLLKVRV
jgi:hypothetical protein